MTLFQFAMTLLHMNDKLFQDIFPLTFKEPLPLHKDKEKIIGEMNKRYESITKIRQ